MKGKRVPDRLILARGTDPDQYYATGLALHGHFLTLIRGKTRVIAAGGFEYPQAKARYPNAIRLEEFGKNWKEIIAAFCKRYRVKAPVLSRTTSAGAYEAMKKACPGATLAKGDLFPERAVKRQDEIRAIKDATRATEAAITAVRAVLADARIVNGKAVYKNKPLTSEYLKRIAAVALAERNYACPDIIISSGAQTALPHDEGSGVICEGTVIVDIFPRSNESFYFSDMTRTFIIGKAPRYFDERYAAVLAVHKESAKHIRDGAKNVEALVKPVFHKHGFLTDLKAGRGYIHSLGHGVGLEIHEEPRYSGTLAAGNVVTIEPGLYYDYGIRVEDIGLVTKAGFQNFSRLSKNPYLH